MNHLPLSRRDLLAIAAAAAAPGIAYAQTAPTRGGVLRVSVDQAVGVLNPLLTRVNPEYLVSGLLYSGLTRLAVDMTAAPDLASSWSPNAELTQWTFTLRPGLRFHDGSPCTAKDVVATFAAIMDPKTASPARTNIGPVDHVEAVDDDTVRFVLKTPYADLPVALAYTNAKIIPAAVASGELTQLARKAVGTGPFRLVSYEPDRQIVVARNEAYYDAPRPYLDRVEVLVYPDPTAEASAMISGDIDLMSNASATEFARLSSAAGVVPLRVASGQFLNVNMGCDQKPFSDVRVRQALALTVDRDAMVGFVAQGYGTPGNDTPMNAAYHFYQAAAGADARHRPRETAAGRERLPERARPDADRVGHAGHAHPACRRDSGNGEARWLPHRRADHAARDVSRSGLEERLLLRRLLQHAGDGGCDLLAAVHVHRRMERDALEQYVVRHAGRRRTRDDRRGETACRVRPGTGARCTHRCLRSSRSSSTCSPPVAPTCRATRCIRAAQCSASIRSRWAQGRRSAADVALLARPAAARSSSTRCSWCRCWCSASRRCCRRMQP